MAKIMGLHDPTASSRRKKTRQGMGRGTKWGRPNGKHYKKKYRGQGKWLRKNIEYLKQ